MTIHVTFPFSRPTCVNQDDDDSYDSFEDDDDSYDSYDDDEASSDEDDDDTLPSSRRPAKPAASAPKKPVSPPKVRAFRPR